MRASDDRSPCPNEPLPALPPAPSEDRHWVSDQLSMLQAEIKLILYSGFITLIGSGIALAFFILHQS